LGGRDKIRKKGGDLKKERKGGGTTQSTKLTGRTKLHRGATRRPVSPPPQKPQKKKVKETKLGGKRESG